MQELNTQEIKSVSGGVAPFLIFTMVLGGLFAIGTTATLVIPHK
ncbi:class IIb bacteriocin, lactobin A/cerein 7B family [Chitinimonas sp. PSY-7]